ncbi:hypothetical protein EDM80_09530, partial [bacterium]
MIDARATRQTRIPRRNIICNVYKVLADNGHEHPVAPFRLRLALDGTGVGPDWRRGAGASGRQIDIRILAEAAGLEAPLVLRQVPMVD